MTTLEVIGAIIVAIVSFAVGYCVGIMNSEDTE